MKKVTAVTLPPPSLLCCKKKKGDGNVDVVTFFAPLQQKKEGSGTKKVTTATLSSPSLLCCKEKKEMKTTTSLPSSLRYNKMKKEGIRHKGGSSP